MTHKTCKCCIYLVYNDQWVFSCSQNPRLQEFMNSCYTVWWFRVFSPIKKISGFWNSMWKIRCFFFETKVNNSIKAACILVKFHLIVTLNQIKASICNFPYVVSLRLQPSWWRHLLLSSSLELFSAAFMKRKHGPSRYSASHCKTWIYCYCPPIKGTIFSLIYNFLKYCYVNVASNYNTVESTDDL